MRVLHILEATAGGTRRHILDLLPALQARGVECHLIHSALRNPTFRHDAAHLQQSGIVCCEIPMGHRWARREDALALRAIYAHLKSHRYDLVHCHSSNAGLLGRLANLAANVGQRRSTPLVYTPHYVAFAAGLPRAQRRAALYLEKTLAGQTSYFIAVSRHEYSLLRRVLKIEPSRGGVIYNGIEAMENGLQKSHSPFSIGCFGRLTAQKNQQVLIRALPAILKEIPDSRLHLFGAGEDASTLRALAQKLNCDHCIDFHGNIASPQDWYASCDVIAQPSRWEGCSYAILEAMAAARAVIASDAGGNPEVLGTAGVLVPSCNDKAWARALLALGKNAAQLEALGTAAQLRMREHFTLDAMVGKTLAVYQRVI
jgi:glycosyltransferase involved in cell wall biosynthesis